MEVFSFIESKWSGRQDLNLRHPAPKANLIVFQGTSYHFYSLQNILTSL